MSDTQVQIEDPIQGTAETGPSGEQMRTMPLAFLLPSFLALQLLLYATSLPARPKVDVRIKVNEGIGKYPPQDTLNKYNSPVAGPLMSGEVFYFNVTVFSDNAEAVAKNNGQWCIKGDIELHSFEYHGTLGGNDLEIEVSQKNGKTKKMAFVVYDHKWRKLSDI
jgi:hypothetical protein